MKRNALVEHLRRNGCVFYREGGRHSIYCNPSTGAKAPVPRHIEIDNRLAKGICRQLGIPEL